MKQVYSKNGFEEALKGLGVVQKQSLPDQIKYIDMYVKKWLEQEVNDEVETAINTFKDKYNAKYDWKTGKTKTEADKILVFSLCEYFPETDTLEELRVPFVGVAEKAIVRAHIDDVDIEAWRVCYPFEYCCSDDDRYVLPIVWADFQQLALEKYITLESYKQQCLECLKGQDPTARYCSNCGTKLFNFEVKSTLCTDINF